jgi:hypothetical protein
VNETYFGDVLQSFGNGVQLDLRVKLAIEFLKAPVSQTAGSPAEVVTFALNLATELLDQSHARGLIKDLPEDNELNAPTRKHLERNVRMQLFQQQAAARIQAEPANHLTVVPEIPRRQ